MLSLRPLPAFQDNYIWTLSNDAGQALVVDPGQAAPVLAAIDAGLRPVAILLTHHHDDHIGGAAELLARFPVPCYAPVEPRIAVTATRVGQGDRVRSPELDLDLDVIEVHGHTRSHIAFHGGGRGWHCPARRRGRSGRSPLCIRARSTPRGRLAGLPSDPVSRASGGRRPRTCGRSPG